MNFRKQIKAVRRAVRRLRRTGKIEPYILNGRPVTMATLDELKERESILNGKFASENKNKKCRLRN